MASDGLVEGFAVGCEMYTAIQTGEAAELPEEPGVGMGDQMLTTLRCCGRECLVISARDATQPAVPQQELMNGD